MTDESLEQPSPLKTVDSTASGEVSESAVERLVMRGSEIYASHWHDAGAYGRCSYCLRYSEDPNCLELDFECDCGRKNGYSGSFKKPETDSIWNA